MVVSWLAIICKVCLPRWPRYIAKNEANLCEIKKRFWGYKTWIFDYSSFIPVEWTLTYTFSVSVYQGVFSGIMSFNCGTWKQNKCKCWITNEMKNIETCTFWKQKCSYYFMYCHVYSYCLITLIQFKILLKLHLGRLASSFYCMKNKKLCEVLEFVRAHE